MAFQLKVKKLSPEAKLPGLETPGSVGFDLYALEETELIQDFVQDLRTGVAIQTAKGMYGRVIPSENLFYKGVMVSEVIIDSHSTKEVVLSCFNKSHKTVRIIEKGEKIARLIVQEYVSASFEVVDELTLPKIEALKKPKEEPGLKEPKEEPKDKQGLKEPKEEPKDK